jgi:hypothetical protein
LPRCGIIFGEGDDQTLKIEVESNLSQKLTLTLTLHFKVKSEPKWQPLNAGNRVNNITLGKIEQKEKSLEAAQRREKAATSRAQKDDAAKRVAEYETELADLKTSLEQLKKLISLAKSMHGKGEIHYRVFYKLGDREIDLVRTEGEGD